MLYPLAELVKLAVAFDACMRKTSWELRKERAVKVVQHRGLGRDNSLESYCEALKELKYNIAGLRERNHLRKLSRRI